MDDRTRLLLLARSVNGVKVNVRGKSDKKLMDQMVQEELFTYSDTKFSEGYWWTEKGKAAAESAWRQAPVQRFETKYRNHPLVRIEVNGDKEELCHVIRMGKGSPLWVREVLGGRWFVSHPTEDRNMPFGSADAAIEWALEQVGVKRK